MDECDLIQKGERLAPLWRGSDGRGLNVVRVFSDPLRSRLIEWLPGLGAAPSLEQGQVSDPGIWLQIERTFGPQLLASLFWFH